MTTTRLLEAAEAVMEWWDTDGENKGQFFELREAITEARDALFPVGSMVEWGSALLPHVGVVLAVCPDGTREILAKGNAFAVIKTTDLRQRSDSGGGA